MLQPVDGVHDQLLHYYNVYFIDWQFSHDHRYILLRKSELNSHSVDDDTKISMFYSSEV